MMNHAVHLAAVQTKLNKKSSDAEITERVKKNDNKNKKKK